MSVIGVGLYGKPACVDAIQVYIVGDRKRSARSARRRGLGEGLRALGPNQGPTGAEVIAGVGGGPGIVQVRLVDAAFAIIIKTENAAIPHPQRIQIVIGAQVELEPEGRGSSVLSVPELAL